MSNPKALVAPFDWRPLTLLLFAAITWCCGCSRPVPQLTVEPDRTMPWSDQVVRELAEVPLQDNGRVKPLSVLAAFTLYYVHGRRDLKFALPRAVDVPESKVTLEPTEWLLDVWCYPRQAANYPLFRIEHSGVLDALGIANDGQRQDVDYVSYADVLAAVDKLQPLAREYGQLDSADRSIVQEHIWQLWLRFNRYDRLQRQVGAFHYSVPVGDERLQQLLGGERVSLTDLVSHADAFRAFVRTLPPDLSNPPDGLLELVDFVSRAVENDSDGARLLAPVAAAANASADEVLWQTMGEAAEAVIRGADGPTRDALVHFGAAVSADNFGDTEQELRAFARAAIAAAAPFVQQSDIERETYYYRASWHYRSLHWFLFGFVLAASAWLLPRSRWLWAASLAVTALALGMLSYDLVLRCLITGRPPIKNLYDTFLFIAATGVAIALVVECVLPRRIALAIAPFAGALLVMFARIYEVSDGKDHMDPLVAVLDSNFWLATHVTSINIGYAAGLFASLFGGVWIALRALRVFHPQDRQMKALYRMTYGVTAFGLSFAVVGTILGGVWANDSWGRFWGWDPKENGALMICLAQIALLHARFSGMVRDFGFAAWSVATGMVVVFSWFHVNLLGIGLHSYGFSAGLRNGVWVSYMVLGTVLAIGVVDRVVWPNPKRREAAGEELSPAPADS